MMTTCDQCGADVPPEEINADLGLGHCPSCDAVFPVTAGGDAAMALEMAPRAVALATSAPAPALDHDIPSSMDVAQRGDDLLIEHRWFTARYLFFAFFSVFWCGFLVVWYAQVLSAPHADPMAVLFPLGHVAVGVGMAYYTLAGFLNRTTIVVAHGQLLVTHGPLPWPGQRNVPTSALEQLYCERHVHKTKNGTRTDYSVNAALRDSGEVVLVKGMPSLEDARFLEWKIEHHLGITDRPMSGEVPK